MAGGRTPHSTPCKSTSAHWRPTARPWSSAFWGPRRSATLGGFLPTLLPHPIYSPPSQSALRFFQTPQAILLPFLPSFTNSQTSKHPRYPYLPLDLHRFPFPDSSKHIATMPQRVIVVGGGREYPPASAAAIAASPQSFGSSGPWLTSCDSVRPQRSAHHLPRRRQRRRPRQAG